MELYSPILYAVVVDWPANPALDNTVLFTSTRNENLFRSIAKAMNARARELELPVRFKVSLVQETPRMSGMLP